jgi:putative hemolysin
LISPATVDDRLGTTPITDAEGRYRVELARDPAGLQGAQRLRHQVFAEEMGASLDSPVTGLDVDRFDAYCDHLLVRFGDAVVGTYRLLPPRRSDRLYSDTEFDLWKLAGIRDNLVEAGRSCVHPDHRNGSVVGLMWAGIARYMTSAGYNWLAGCCSVPLTDGGATAAGVVDRLAPPPAEFAVVPHHPWSPEGIQRPERSVIPPLLRGYLRLGAFVCGPPAFDPDFNTADFFVLLSVAQVNPRYMRHLLGERT